MIKKSLVINNKENTNIKLFNPIWYGDKGFFAGGVDILSTPTSEIQYIVIPIMSNSYDFGDLTYQRFNLGACSDGTIGIFSGGASDIPINTIDYIIFSLSNISNDYGNLEVYSECPASCSNGIKGLFSGGSESSYIYYITIRTLMNAFSFGNLTDERYCGSAVSDGTKAFFIGSNNSESNIIDFINIATGGSSTNCGELLYVAAFQSACGNKVKSLIIGGSDYITYNPIANIQYFTFSTLGTTTDFGNLNQSKSSIGSCCNSNRCVIAGGVYLEGGSEYYINSIEYISMSNSGDYSNFGELSSEIGGLAANSGN